MDGNKITVKTKNNLSEEIKVKELLEEALEKYPYPVFTDKVLIGKKEISHSSPMLTIGAWDWIKNFDKPEVILFEIFVHEQFHWFLLSLDADVWNKGFSHIKEKYQPQGDIFNYRKYNREEIFWIELVVCFNTMNYLRKALDKEEYNMIYERRKNRPYPKTEKFIEDNFEKLYKDLEELGLAYENILIDKWTKYFGVEKIKEITWAHAVNSSQGLKNALKNNIHFIETDITADKKGDIICAHPPDLESDLSFCDLLEKIKGLKLGLKLDFKIPEILHPALDILEKFDITQPLILNADILQGNKGPVSLFDPKKFLNNCQAYTRKHSNVMISPGWETEKGCLYTQENIKQMIAFCQSLGSVTFPVRLSLLEKSWPQIKQLLEKSGWTLSVWSGTDLVTCRQRQWLNENIDPARIFLDVM